MNPNGIRFFFDSDFRDKYIHDYNFWIIIFGLSYWIIITLARNWTIKNFKPLLVTAIGLSIVGNIFGFIIFKTNTALGALNGPLITLLTYRFLCNWFKKKYGKLPATPYETHWSNDSTLMKDGFLNFTFVLISVISTVFLAFLTNKW